MQAVILAAGKGIRLRPLTENTPKPMLKIAGKPILEHTLLQLPEEVDEVILVVGYLKEQIKNYFGNEFFGKKIIYVEPEENLGTAHALRSCKDFLKDNKFISMMGDDLYSKKDISECIKYDLCVLVRELDDSRRFGAIKVNQDGILERIEDDFSSGTGSNLVNIGLFVLDKRFFDYEMVRVSTGEFGLPQTVSKMAKDYPVKVVKASFWFPISRPEDLKKAEEFFL